MQAFRMQGRLMTKFLSNKEIYFIAKRCISNVQGATANAENENRKHYDIIIGGGGLVGTALAAALSKNKTLADYQILVLEGAPASCKGFDVAQPYGNRVSAINKKTIDLFENIGAWQHICNARVKHVKQMQVWEANSNALIQFQHNNFADDVACIVENDLMLHAFNTVLKESCPNVLIRNSSKIAKVNLVTEQNPTTQITLESGEKFTCDLLVGADGANSLIRKEMNVDVFAFSYKEMGLVATLEIEESGDNSVAWQRFIPTGPVALLPLSDKYMSLVWSTNKEHAEQLQKMDAEDFIDALNEAFFKDYPKSSIIEKAIACLNTLTGSSSNTDCRQYPPVICSVVEGSRATFPLGFLHAASYIATGVALIGDAAHRVHPLAGQGVNLGFSDVCFLVEAVANAAYSGATLGSKHYLLTYEQNCLKQNVPLLLGIHGMHTLYSSTFSPIVFLRSVGLQATHNLPSIKNIFLKRAMGVS